VKPPELLGHDGDLTRRGATARLVTLLAGAIVVSTTARTRATEIVQPPRPDPAAFMERAFAMRRLAIERGDQPYGAVVVQAGRIVGEGVSAVVTANDPTAHAEMQAIRDAARRLGTRDLSRCEMYGTSRACTMCEAAAHWAGIARMLHGEAVTDAGAPQLR
jgi:tRNA(Arg) A34 adenosine deaminase TadA